MGCLNISGAPFRFELNRTALLSGVQEYGEFSFSSRVSRLSASKCVPSAASVPMETKGDQRPLRIVSTLPSALPTTCEIQPDPPVIRFGGPEIFANCRSGTTQRLESCRLNMLSP